MVMKRHARHVGLPPPLYHPDSDSITISVCYGGMPVHVPEAKYVGGSIVKYDYMSNNECCLGSLNMWCDSVGIKAAVDSGEGAEGGEGEKNGEGDEVLKGRRVQKGSSSVANPLESRKCSKVQTTHSIEGQQFPDILPPAHEDNNEEDELEDAVITQEPFLTQVTPTFRPGPSMYQQMTITNQHLGLHPRLQFRAPPPMVGPHPVPRFNPPRTSSQVVNYIITK
ncbi:hypothetical protein Salat_2504700 [Sesamum alatum]|uniref:Uncharacterized protein n=1 Tax=Sesamum alatum TaxID=300844 RepID=A0AAE2CC82_9LAMI|nr:hypothetical protein Salat_2504700 [Sesamum alatum]